MIKKSSNFAAGKKKKLFRARGLFTSLLKRKYNENLFYNVLFLVQRKEYTKIIMIVFYIAKSQYIHICL
jgi:hypothetical protein